MNKKVLPQIQPDLFCFEVLHQAQTLVAAEIGDHQSFLVDAKVVRQQIESVPTGVFLAVEKKMQIESLVLRGDLFK